MYLFTNTATVCNGGDGGTTQYPPPSYNSRPKTIPMVNFHGVR